MSLATIQHESSEKGGELVVRVEREYVRNVLIGSDDHHRTLRTVDAAQNEDVRAVLEVAAEGLLVVNDLEASLSLSTSYHQ